MKKKNDMLRIPCPACGSERAISHSSWRNTFAEETKWNAKVGGYIISAGPNEMLECYVCDDSYPAGRWHRALERREFARRGWRTPRMEKSHDTI